MPLCNARLKKRPGERCRKHALKGRTRCRLHGGRSRGQTTADGKRRASAAGVKGQIAWRKRMHEARRLGIIEHVPWYGMNWKKNRLTAPKPTQRQVAMTIAEKALEQLPAPVDKPFAEQTMGEQLASNTRAALKKAHDILALPLDEGELDEAGKYTRPPDYKLMSIQKDLAQSLIATQQRVDESVMRAQRTDRLPALLNRIKAIQDGTLIEQPAPQKALK